MRMESQGNPPTPNSGTRRGWEWWLVTVLMLFTLLVCGALLVLVVALTFVKGFD